MSPHTLVEGCVFYAYLVVLLYTRIIYSIPVKGALVSRTIKPTREGHSYKLETHWTIFTSVFMAALLSSGEVAEQIAFTCSPREPHTLSAILEVNQQFARRSSQVLGARWSRRRG